MVTDFVLSRRLPFHCGRVLQELIEKFVMNLVECVEAIYNRRKQVVIRCRVSLLCLEI